MWKVDASTRPGRKAMRPADTLTNGNSRRNLWRALAAVSIALCLLLRASPHGHATAVQDKPGGAHGADGQGGSLSEIRLGMSADFTAGARALGIELYRGATAYLLPVNAAGGVDGRRIVIKPYDDQYDPDLAIRNTVKLMDQDNVFALFGYVGTPTMNRTLPLLRMRQDKDFLLLFPFSGAETNRIPPYDRFSFNLRASYDQETGGLVEHFISIHRTRIAVYYQDDAYGRAGWAGVRDALAKHGLDIAGEATYRRGTPFDHSYDSQVAIMQRVAPDAVICVATYAAAAGFVRDMRNRGVQCPIATISFVGSEAMLGLLSAAAKSSNKDYTSRLVSSEVVPSYYDDSLPVVREYRKAMDRNAEALMPPDSLLYRGGKTPQREYAPLRYSFISLEGYLDAKLLVMILRRMGRTPQRAGLAAAVMGLGDFDLGMGQPFSFGGSTGRRQASDQVYYTVVKDGRSVPFRDSEWGAWAKP
jgi:ABC-type branched-subunit amino acid transport system substrate-binding protein